MRGVAVFRRRSRFGDPGKEENFRSGPAPRALPCAASCVDVCARHGPRSVGDAYAGGVVRAASRAHGRHMFAPRRVHGRHMFARAACAGRLAPYRASVGSRRVRWSARTVCAVGSRRIGRRRAAQRVGLRVKFSLLYRRGLVRAPVSLTASCVGACPAGDRSFPRAFARGAARMRADTKRVSVLLYRKGRGFCRAPFRRLRRVSSFRLAAVFIFFSATCGGFFRPAGRSIFRSIFGLVVFADLHAADLSADRLGEFFDELDDARVFIGARSFS